MIWVLIRQKIYEFLVIFAIFVGAVVMMAVFKNKFEVDLRAKAGIVGTTIDCRYHLAPFGQRIRVFRLSNELPNSAPHPVLRWIQLGLGIIGVVIVAVGVLLCFVAFGGGGGRMFALGSVMIFVGWGLGFYGFFSFLA